MKYNFPFSALIAKSKSQVSLLQRILIAIVFAIAGLHTSLAQNIDPKFQAVFINGVARKIEWSSADPKFKIGVIGSNKPLVNELRKLASSRLMDNKSVEVEELKSASQRLNQDIIFMVGKNKSQLDQLLGNASKNSLVVTAYNGGLEDGSHLNFILKGNKISFELNKSALQNTNLIMTDDLIKLASVVK